MLNHYDYTVLLAMGPPFALVYYDYIVLLTLVPHSLQILELYSITDSGATSHFRLL